MIDAASVRAAVSRVVDPELPELTIEDLGILRDVCVDGRGHVEVDITPTYSGCPATGVIRRDVERALRDRGVTDAEVRVVLSPAWTTDWITERGRAALLRAGIAPPAPAGGASRPLAAVAVACPRCASESTQETSRFGSAPCRALRRCTACSEPFDHVKPH